MQTYKTSLTAAEEIKSSPFPLPLLPPVYRSYCLHCDGLVLLHWMHGEIEITLTVLSEDKCVYMERTDTPPNEYALMLHRGKLASTHKARH